MTEKKKKVHRAVSAMALITFAFIYNHDISGVRYYKSGSFVFYLCALSAIISVSFMFMFVFKKVLEIDFIHTKMPAKFFWPYITVAGLLTKVLGACLKTSGNITAKTTVAAVYIIMVAYPGIMYMKQTVENGKSFETAASFSAVSVAGFFGGGAKTAIFTAAIFVFAEAAAFLMTGHGGKNKKKLIAATVFMLAVLCAAAVFIPGVSARIKDDFRMPQTEEYKIITENLKCVKLFCYNPRNDFITEVYTSSGAVYAHLLYTYGLFITLVLIFLQIYTVILIFKRSKTFSDGNRKFAGTVSAAMIGLQLTAGLGSSLCILPLSGWGCPFISVSGLEFCLFPLLIFGYLELRERGGELFFVKDIDFLHFDDFDEDEYEEEDEGCFFDSDGYVMFKLMQFLQATDEKSRAELEGLLKEIHKDAVAYVMSECKSSPFDEIDKYRANLKKANSFLKVINPDGVFYDGEDKRKLLACSYKIVSWRNN